MTKIFFTLTFFFSLSVLGQTQADDQKSDIAFNKAINKWFAAWTLVSNDIYKVDRVRPVEFIFFDDKYVYSTSKASLNNETSLLGCNLMNLSFTWKKVIHNDSISLPDKSIVPIRLMSYAAEIPTEKNKSFFVMPLPSYWEMSGIDSKELGIDNLVTGVFIHEFSHSQQMQNFGKRMTLFEKQNNFGVDLSDDIIQNIFEKDSNYLALYNLEVQRFYLSVQHNIIDKTLVKEAISIMTKRQNEYFKGDYLKLKEIDNFFLTMEGLGQYSMYVWLTHPNGGNLKKDIAIEGVRRGGKWWSQEEGFALFLILDKLAKPEAWAKRMFGNKTVSVIDLIRKHLP